MQDIICPNCKKVFKVDELPFMLSNQKPMIDLVNKILSTTKEKGYLTDVTKQAKVCDYEKQIEPARL